MSSVQTAMMDGRSKDWMKREAIKEKAKVALIYDGACPICSSTVVWIKDNEKEGSFDMVPCQTEALDRRFPAVKGEECLKAMHLVLPDGTVLSGEKALPEIFTRLRRYRFGAIFFKLPGAAVLSRIFYQWFANRRYRISRFFHLVMPKK